MFQAEQIRSGFIDFFKAVDHTFVPSAPVVPVDSVVGTLAGDTASIRQDDENDALDQQQILVLLH